MLTNQVADLIDCFLDEVEALQDLPTALSQLAKWHGELLAYWANLHEKFDGKEATVREILQGDPYDQVHEALPTWSPVRLFAELDRLETSVRSLDSLHARTGVLISGEGLASLSRLRTWWTQKDQAESVPHITADLVSTLSDFRIAYEDYLRKGRPESPHALTFIYSGSRLQIALSATVTVLQKVAAQLRGERTIASVHDGKRLSVLLGSKYSFAVFVEKLTALETMYVELCFLVGSSHTDYPASIVKIESGSLLVDIIGHVKVISLLTTLLERGFAHLRQSFRERGKITKIPRHVEAAESVLGLRRQLKALGIDTTAMDANLQKTGVILSNELNALLLGEPRIKINGVTHSIEPELSQRFLEERKRLMLPEPEGEDHTSNTTSRSSSARGQD